MMRIQKRPAVLFVGFVVVFSFSYVVYAAAIKKVSGSHASSFVVTQKLENKKEAVDASEESASVNDQFQSGAQGVQQPSDVSFASSDETSLSSAPSLSDEKSKYPLHKNITVTYFWAGEEADADNKNISNLPSAWDEDWVKHFGGVDSPSKRSGFAPAEFVPKENPFYFALPYNDFDTKGNRKKEVYTIVSWSKSQSWGEGQSILKNQWIKIIKDGKTAYAQWQDVGPFKEDDAAYVFGTATPKSKTNHHAGLDVSPAVHDLLGLGDIDTVDWQFIDADQVPDGPWKKIVTTSQVYWK